MGTPADRLRKARQDAGFASAEAAAKRFNWKASTYRHHENGHRDVSPEAAETYGEAFRVDPSWLLCLKDSSEPGSGGAVGELEIVGEAAIGVWREPVVGSQQHSGKKMISVPATTITPKGQKRFCVRVADASMSKEFASGSYVICAKLSESSPEIHDFSVGDVLYIERTRRGLTELSLRRVSFVNGEKMRLSSHSNDPKFKQEISYPPSNASVETIVLLGKVVGTYADFPRSSP